MVDDKDMGSTENDTCRGKPDLQGKEVVWCGKEGHFSHGYKLMGRMLVGIAGGFYLVYLTVL